MGGVWRCELGGGKLPEGLEKIVEERNDTP